MSYLNLLNKLFSIFCNVFLLVFFLFKFFIEGNIIIVINVVINERILI